MPARARTAAVGAVLLSGLLVLVWYAAFHIPIVEHADRAILAGFGGLGRHPRVPPLAHRIATLCDVDPYVFLCLVPLGTAIFRRRAWVALAIAAILLGANVTTELLKPLLAAPRPGFFPRQVIAAGSWPSGHATAAMSLALSCIISAPARWRPAVAALGAGFAVAVSYSFLSLQWHYPSDVLGGYLVAGVWTLTAITGVLLARRRSEQELDIGTGTSFAEVLVPSAAALAALLLLAALVLLARPHAVVAFTSAHKTFVVGAAAIAGLGLALASGLALTLRR